MNTLMNSHMTERISISTGTNLNSKMNEKKSISDRKIGFLKNWAFQIAQNLNRN